MVFLGDMAFYMATLVFAVGIYMIHHAKHHQSEQCKLLKSGGYIVTTIALLGMLCTGYYWMKYFYQGAYITASNYSMQQGMMGGNMSGHMMPGMMGNRGMMMGGGQNPQMMNHFQQCMGQMQGKMMGPEMMEQMQICFMGGSAKSSEENK
jgi:hypothetical protein